MPARPGPLPSRPAGDLVVHCARWQALHTEIDRLTERWSALEARAIRESDWHNLSEAQRRDLPIAAEMAQIDRWLDALFEAQDCELEALLELPPTDAHGALSKLAVAARLAEYEGGEMHRLIGEAVRVLGTLGCSVYGNVFVERGY